MIIALFPNASKPESMSLALGVQEFLTARGIQVIAGNRDAKSLKLKPLSDIDIHTVDFFISMGGDGTILNLAHQYPEAKAAILGINLGHLGFMADVTVEDLYPSLQDLLDGAYRIEERLVIDGATETGKDSFAVNDIVVHRGVNPSLVEIAVHLDGLYLNTFTADGMVIATPNGSTAYSLAAGGPIVYPTIEAIILTPISPHTISNRPLVLPPDQEIQIQYLSQYEALEIRADGMTYHTLKTGEIFRIRRSKRKFRLVNLLRRDYFTTLRTKLGWSGKLRGF